MSHCLILSIFLLSDILILNSNQTLCTASLKGNVCTKMCVNLINVGIYFFELNIKDYKNLESSIFILNF